MFLERIESGDDRVESDIDRKDVASSAVLFSQVVLNTSKALGKYKHSLETELFVVKGEQLKRSLQSVDRIRCAALFFERFSLPIVKGESDY